MRQHVLGLNLTPVESVFDIYNDDQTWNLIKGFRGYEISNKGVIRSLKHYKKYPYGIIIQPQRGTNDVFVLSDNDNMRKRLHLYEIEKLRDVERGVTYTNTICRGFQSRTQRHFIHFDKVEKDKDDFNVVSLPVLPRDDSELKKTFIPQFTIIDEKPKVIKPLIFHNL